MTDAANAEQIVRDGPDSGSDSGPAVLFILPFFEEANRMRRTVRRAMRTLAARGIASLLPDLPGQNESLMATDAATLADWRAALAAYSDGKTVTAAIRGGALIDDIAAAAHWRLAPVKGASLLKSMLRTRIASDREYGLDTTMAELEQAGEAAPLRLAGNDLSPAMIAGLRAAAPASLSPCRNLMLGEGADRLPGRPLWLQAEPGEDAALAEAMAADIATWMASCGIS